MSCNGVIHAHWAAEQTTQLYKASQAGSKSLRKQTLRDAQDAAQYTRCRHASCYGKAVWDLQGEQLGWPLQLLSATRSSDHDCTPMAPTPCPPNSSEVALTCDDVSSGYVANSASAKSEVAWDYTVLQTEDLLRVSIAIPLHIEIMCLL